MLSETSYYHSSTVAAVQVQALCRPLLTWSVEHLFPLYDVLRVLVTHPHGAETLAGPQRQQFMQVVQRTLTLLSAEGPSATTLTAVRFLCNCVKCEPVRMVVYTEPTLVQLLQGLSSLTTNSNKLVRAAGSRIVLNIAGFATRVGVFTRLSLSATVAASLVSTIAALLQCERESAEVVSNAVCALGTLKVSGINVGDSAQWKGLLQTLQTTWDPAKLQGADACLVDTLALL